LNENIDGLKLSKWRREFVDDIEKENKNANDIDKKKKTCRIES